MPGAVHLLLCERGRRVWPICRTLGSRLGGVTADRVVPVPVACDQSTPRLPVPNAVWMTGYIISSYD